jgi:multiple sugar transport system ATP-binding protein
MRTEIALLHKRLGTTFIYVTHDQTEAMTMGDRIVVMDSGIIQQTDTPENLYHKPKNIFVASFIGSPTMNFLEGTLRKDEKGFYVQVKNDIFRVARRTDNMYNNIDKSVTIGIRPEDLLVDTAGSSLRGTLKVQENLGSEAYIYIQYADTLLTVRSPYISPKTAGEAISFTAKADKIHIFRKDSGENIGI